MGIIWGYVGIMENKMESAIGNGCSGPVAPEEFFVSTHVLAR